MFQRNNYRAFTLAAIAVISVLAIASLWMAEGRQEPLVGAERATSHVPTANSKYTSNANIATGKTRPIDATEIVSIDDIDPAEALLDPEIQKYIWDAEHVTHMLEWRFGAKFKQALRERDQNGLFQFLATDFFAEVPELNPNNVIQKSLVRQVSMQPGRSRYSEIDGRNFAQWLLKLVEDFHEIEKTSLRILNIDRLDDQGNQWQLRLFLTANGTNESGRLLELQSTQQVQCGWQDASQIDGGSILQNWRTEEVFIRTSERPLLEDVTARVGLDRLPIPDNWKLSRGRPQRLRFQMAVEDFDRDGFLDVAVATLDGRLMLLRSDRGRRFAEATRSVGLPVVTPRQQLDYSVGWIDYDNDGFPDLLMAGNLYRNVSGRRFENVTTQSGLRFERKLMGYAVADYDLDGLLDLYFIYAGGTGKTTGARNGWIGDDGSGAENKLWRNVGNGRFVDVTAQSGASGGRMQSFAANWILADEDLYPDLYVANDFGNNLLLRNRGDGTFEDISRQSGTSDYATSMGVATGHLDDDGLPEIYVANMFSKMGRRIIAQVGPQDYPAGIFEQIKGACAGNRLYRLSAGQPRYREFGEQFGISAVGWAYAPAMLDFDNDGQLDLYSTTGFMSFDRTKPDG